MRNLIPATLHLRKGNIPFVDIEDGVMLGPILFALHTESRVRQGVTIHERGIAGGREGNADAAERSLIVPSSFSTGRITVTTAAGLATSPNNFSRVI